MLITLSRRAAICQSFAEVQLTGVAPLGAVSHRFNFFLINNNNNKIQSHAPFLPHYLYMYHKNKLSTELIQNTSLVQWPACLTTDHGVTGSIPGTSTNFKYGFGLERGPPSLVRTIGQLLDEEIADLIRKSTFMDLRKRNANHIIPSFCHQPFICRSLVDRCSSLGSYKPQT